MFDTKPQKSNTLWKILPVAIVIFAALVAGVSYLQRTAAPPPGPVEGVLRAGDPDFDWYNKYVMLESRGIKMGKNFAGKRMVMFSGVVENGGEKYLDVVEVKLTLFNYDEPVFDRLSLPIRPAPHTPPVEPLKSRAFTVYLENIPGEWLASRAEMEIHGFRFAN